MRKGIGRVQIGQVLRPLVSLIVKLLVFQLGCALLACLLVLLAVGLLAVHPAVLDEPTGRAVLELDVVACELPAVGAGVGFVAIVRNLRHAVHHIKFGVFLEVEVERVCACRVPARTSRRKTTRLGGSR